jgi:hypothetical protein
MPLPRGIRDGLGDSIPPELFDSFNFTNPTSLCSLFPDLAVGDNSADFSQLFGRFAQMALMVALMQPTIY